MTEGIGACGSEAANIRRITSAAIAPYRITPLSYARPKAGLRPLTEILKISSSASEIFVSETVKSYLDLREEADLLSRLLFADRFSSARHGEAIEAALSIHLSARGAEAFDPPFWYVSTSNFETYQVSSQPSGRFAVRLDSFATFREVELWKYAIARAEEESGHPLAGRGAYLAPGFLPWTDTSVIAIALLKQAIRTGAPSRSA